MRGCYHGGDGPNSPKPPKGHSGQIKKLYIPSAQEIRNRAVESLVYEISLDPESQKLLSIIIAAIKAASLLGCNQTSISKNTMDFKKVKKFTHIIQALRLKGYTIEKSSEEYYIYWIDVNG